MQKLMRENLIIFKKITNILFNNILIYMHKFNFPFSILKTLLKIRKPDITMWVPLSAISFFMPNKQIPRIFPFLKVHKLNTFFILSGDWDLRILPIDNLYSKHSIAYKAIFQMFNEKKDYKETDEYKNKLKKIRKGATSSRGRNKKDLDNYFSSLINLKRSIERNGYKNQIILKGKKEDEIGVFIGRDGKLIKPEDQFSGTHRFAIAKYLNLSEIFVQVVAVHEEWAKNNLESLLLKDVGVIQKHINSNVV
ncbi:MAG: hypothetical protein ACQESB_00450 [Elusimicrobiota bacterium]